MFVGRTRLKIVTAQLDVWVSVSGISALWKLVLDHPDSRGEPRGQATSRRSRVSTFRFSWPSGTGTCSSLVAVPGLRARPQEGCKPDGESGCLIHEALEGWHFISQGQVSQELMDSGRTRGYLAPQPGTIPWGLEVPADADQVKRLPAGCSVVGWREQQS